MENKSYNMMFVFSYFIKLLVTISFLGMYWGVFYSLFFVALISWLLYKKSNLFYFVCLVMMDFLFVCLAYNGFAGVNIESLLVTLKYFVLSNGLVYFLSINYLAMETSPGRLKYNSNIEIDKGIKALENQDYDKAMEAFTNAIKEHKQNYLGYVGMCNVLSETDKKNLRKYKYYKKKSLRYAPDTIKEELKNKY